MQSNVTFGTGKTRRVEDPQANSQRPANWRYGFLPDWVDVKPSSRPLNYTAGYGYYAYRVK